MSLQRGATASGRTPVTTFVLSPKKGSVNAIALSVLVKVIVVSLCWRAFVSRGELVERNVQRDHRRVEIGLFDFEYLPGFHLADQLWARAVCGDADVSETKIVWNFGRRCLIDS